MAPIAAAVVDVVLIAIFGFQHSMMARPGFKRVWTRVVPPTVERSVYVLFASIALLILFRFWQPIDRTVWAVAPDMRWLSTILWVMFWGGFGVVLISTFLINHFELFGLQQAWVNLRGGQMEKPELRQPLFYRWVAHPLYAGFFLAFWATPHMTMGHLLLAVALSIYMLIAIRYEEHDLTDVFGEDYRRYRSGVGMLVPRFRRRSI
jgi:protein-S-isoprenylcysteine O-methyltransferase Ste14